MRFVTSVAVAVVVAVVVAVLAVACGSRVDPATPAPTTGPSTTAAPATTTTAASGDDALSVGEALEAEEGATVVVAGALSVEGGVVRLCSALAESFPPQCGGASLVVEGLDLSDFDLEEEQGIRWSEDSVEIEGVMSGGVLRVG